MHHSTHHPLFVVLSLLVAVLGSWTALDLFRRVTGHFGSTRLAWLAAASLAMGVSIWSMHFVAMLGFDPGSAVSYDPVLTFASLVIAIGSTAGAFFVAAADGAGRGRILLAGAAMGAGICAMHYVGMAALESAVSLGYDLRLVALSLVIAVVAATAALFVARADVSQGGQALSAIVLGLAIVGMHYTAMTALHLAPLGGVSPVPGKPPFLLAVAVAAATLLLLFLALVASLYDQRGNILSALEAGGVGYWELDLRSFALHISPKGKAIFGIEAEDRLSYAEALSRIAPESREERARRLADAVANGTDYDIEYPLADGRRWVNARGRTVHSRVGKPARMVGVVIDVTERRQALQRIIGSEKRQRLLIDELNHRVKNTLATVQSIARQTARRAATTAAFHESFEGRLMALSATHNALTRGGWEEASLRELLDNALKSDRDRRVSIVGDDVALGTRHALALGMVIHEMAANAARHGALSRPDGRLDVRVGVEGEGEAEMLVLDWRETGRVAEAAPGPAGFGSRLIRHSVEAELGGTARLSFGEAGFTARLVVPLADGALYSRAAE